MLVAAAFLLLQEAAVFYTLDTWKNEEGAGSRRGDGKQPIAEGRMVMRVIPLDNESQLKQLEPRDAAEMFRLIDSNRAYLRQWLPWVDYNVSVEDTAGFIAMKMEQHNNNQGTHYGIWHQGRLAGTLGVHRIDWFNKNTALGYWLAAPFQGRGLMTKAVAVYMDRLVFGSWGLERLAIQAATGNVRSRAIPERLGFQLEGVLRHIEFLNGRFVDHAVYSMLRSEWQARRKQWAKWI